MDENKITIAVCGESFCTACIVELKETGVRGHFSQILEDQYGYKILQFAHGGFSNTGIMFQIQEERDLLERNAIAEAKSLAKASAEAKLSALGLTPEEIAALS